MLIGKIGVLDVAVAGSHNDNGGGGLVTLGFERQTQRLGFGVNTRLASRYFEQNGLPPRGRVPLAQTTAHIGWNAARFGSFGLNYIRRDNRGEPDNEIISANYSLNIGGNWFVALSAFKNMKGSQDYSVGFMLTRAIGKRTTASVNVNQRSGPDSLLFQVQQNLPAGAGVGYRVLAGPENHGRLEGTLNLQNNFGTLTLEAGRVSGLEAYRASATGGMAVLGGRAFLSRSLGDSFAVVHVPSYPNVRVYAENQEVARTDKSGVALVPRLRPYQRNRLRIEQMDLPLDSRIDKLEINAVPYFRSGYYVEFPVRKANGALLRVVSPDGEPLPAGATVRIDEREEAFPIGLDGRIYVTGLEQNNRMVVTVSDTHRCTFEVSFAETSEPVPDLGNFLCEKVSP